MRSCQGRRCTPQQATIWDTLNALPLPHDTTGMRVVQRGYALERDLELALDVEQSVRSRVGHAGYSISPDGYGAPGEGDLLDHPGILYDPHHLNPPVQRQQHRHAAGRGAAIARGFVQVHAADPVAVLHLDLGEDGTQLGERVECGSPVAQHAGLANLGEE